MIQRPPQTTNTSERLADRNRNMICSRDSHRVCGIFSSIMLRSMLDKITRSQSSDKRSA
jgi:hypothetical protein